jgi:putative ABC transport system permease protein
MRHDLRDAVRALRRAPTFTLTAVLTLALAIAGATAMFSVIDAVVLRGLPYTAPGRLLGVYERSDAGDLRLPSYPTVRDWQQQSANQGQIAGFAFVRGNGVTMAGRDGPEQKAAAYVTPGFFSLMGTRPLVGRAFLPDDERSGAPPVAVISYNEFIERFNGDPAVIGKRIDVDSMPVAVVGVMPRGFAYPNFGSGGWLPPALWQPIASFEATHKMLASRGLHVDSRAILRLRRGADSAGAAAAMRTIQRRLADAYPREQAHWNGVELRSLSDEIFGGLWSTLALITGAIALVVMLACANVANLLLLRSSVRARDLALRAALGAGTWRLVRHVLVEAAVIAAVAGVAGIGLAVAMLAALRPYAAHRLPFATDITVDSRAALFVIGMIMVTTLLVGVLPAIHAARGSLVARLRGGPAIGSSGGGERRVRNSLVLVQLVLATTVVVVTGLLVQSVRRVSAVPLGYDDSGVISLTIAPPSHKYEAPAQAAALYRRIIDATRAVPSVESSAAAGGALLPTKVETEDRRGDGTPPLALYHPISEEYLSVYRIPIVAGRGFTDADMRSPNGFLVSENLAKRFWPGARALGQRITVYRASQGRADFGQPITLPVVGVVADYRAYGRENPSPAQVFLPYTLEVWPWMNFVVRAPKSAAVLREVTDAVKAVDPAIVFRGTPSVSKSGLAESLTEPRGFLMQLMGVFAATALVLAAVGLYGVVAYGVAQRAREIGIRIAVGATSGGIVRLLLAEAARVVCSGIAFGLIAGVVAGRLLRATLFDTSPMDAATLVVAPAVLAVAATIASLLPARRATRTDPIIVIRSE